MFSLKSAFFYFLWLEILYDVFSVYVKSQDAKYIFYALIFFFCMLRAKHRFKSLLIVHPSSKFNRQHGIVNFLHAGTHSVVPFVTRACFSSRSSLLPIYSLVVR